jgi:hypothetical protein
MYSRRNTGDSILRQMAWAYITTKDLYLIVIGGLGSTAHGDSSPTLAKMIYNHLLLVGEFIRDRGRVG